MWSSLCDFCIPTFYLQAPPISACTAITLTPPHWYATVLTCHSLDAVFPSTNLHMQQPDSVACMVTGFYLDNARIVVRFPQRTRELYLLQSDQNGPGVHPVSYTMGPGSLPGVKRPTRGVYHPPPSSAEVKERVELYLYSPSGSSWLVIVWILP